MFGIRCHALSVEPRSAATKTAKYGVANNRFLPRVASFVNSIMQQSLALQLVAAATPWSRSGSHPMVSEWQPPHGLGVAATPWSRSGSCPWSRGSGLGVAAATPWSRSGSCHPWSRSLQVPVLLPNVTSDISFVMLSLPCCKLLTTSHKYKVGACQPKTHRSINFHFHNYLFNACEEQARYDVCNGPHLYGCLAN